MLVAGGSTNVTTYFAMRLTADGKAATGLTITNFDLQYVRSGVAPVAKVDATALAATDSAHGDNQAIEIDATDAPGLYRVDWPDAAFSAGVREVILSVKVATAFTEHIRVEIDGEVNVVEWAGTDVTISATSAKPEVDVNSISDDATAANNLELMYDTTGYTDDTAPASRSQVDNIGSASGGSLNFANNLDNIDAAIKSITFEGVETSGTNASIDAEDGTSHVIDDSANNIDIVYRFDVGGGRTATELTFKGFLNGSNDSATIQVYNGTSFDVLFTLNGKNGSTNDTVSIPLLSKYTGTGTDIGLVFIRIECAGQSNPTLNTDQLLVAAVNIGQSVGYALGAAWIDTVDGVAGTESFVNGTADNPASSLANAITIASAVNLHRFVVSPGSSITFAEGHTNEIWAGEGWTLALGGQDISDTHITGADVSGIGTTPAGEAHFDHCEFGATTLGKAHIDLCDIKGTLTLSAAAEYFILGCYHALSTSPIVDFGSAVGNTTVHVHDYHGAMTINNMGQSGTDVFHFSSSDGNLTLASNCVGGTVHMNGTFDFVNNGSGITINRGGDAINEISTRATPAQVNTEMLDVFTVDTFVEAAGVVAATASIKDMIVWLKTLARNKITQTAAVQTLRNDADGADIATANVADDGTTFTRDEWL